MYVCMYVHLYVHTYMQTYVHKYITYTYVHTVHAYIHVGTPTHYGGGWSLYTHTYIFLVCLMILCRALFSMHIMTHP